MSKITITREHHFEYAHRLHNHPGKCFMTHGHEGVIVWHLHGPVDNASGMIIDFYKIKSNLDAWVDQNLDHHFLMHDKDPFHDRLKEMDFPGLVSLSFIPTSENLAEYLRTTLNEKFFADTEIELFKVDFWETSNAYATSEA